MEKHTGSDAVPEPPRGLVDALKSGNAVAIIGSGLSCSAGAPTWESLLLQLIAEAQGTQPSRMREVAEAASQVQQRHFLDAASVIKSVLGPDFCNDVALQLERNCALSVSDLDHVAIEKALSGKYTSTLFNSTHKLRTASVPISPTRCHKILAQLGFRAVVTTNYDTLLENAWTDKKPAVFSWSSQDWPSASQRGKSFILKLHGDVNHPSDIILAREDYATEIFANKARRALHGLFTQRILFWVGYGHNDPDLDLILDECRSIPGISGGYALALESDQNTRHRLGQVKATASLLESYSDVESYLFKLAIKAERSLVFCVHLTVQWSNEGNAIQIAQDLLDELNRTYNMTLKLAKTERGSIRAHIEAGAADLQLLDARLQDGDSEFLQILRRHKVGQWNGNPVVADPDSVTQLLRPHTSPPPSAAARPQILSSELTAALEPNNDAPQRETGSQYNTPVKPSRPDSGQGTSPEARPTPPTMQRAARSSVDPTDGASPQYAPRTSDNFGAAAADVDQSSIASCDAFPVGYQKAESAWLPLSLAIISMLLSLILALVGSHGLSFQEYWAWYIHGWFPLVLGGAYLGLIGSNLLMAVRTRRRSPKGLISPLAVFVGSIGIALAPTLGRVVVHPPDVVVKIIGSNTIGEDLMPTLVDFYCRQNRPTNFDKKIGEEPFVTKIRATFKEPLEGLHNARDVLFWIQYPGTKKGADDMISRDAEGLVGEHGSLWMASSPITYNPHNMAPAKSLIAFDAITIIVQKNDQISELTFPQLNSIFNTGRAGEGQREFKPCWRKESLSGTTKEFEDFIGLPSHRLDRAPSKSAVECTSHSDVVAKVASHTCDIGYVSYAFVQGIEGVKVVPVKGPTSSSAMSPTVANIVKAVDTKGRYPMARELELYTIESVEGDPSRVAESDRIAQAVAKFAATDAGQAAVRRALMVPLHSEGTEPPPQIPAYDVNPRGGLAITFPPRSYSIDDMQTRHLAEWAREQCGYARRLAIYGFADTNGSLTYNNVISALRAAYVNVLLEKDKPHDCKFSVGGVLSYGSEFAKGTLEDSRRVEIYEVP